MDRNIIISIISIAGGLLMLIFRDSFARRLLETEEQFSWWAKGTSTLGAFKFLTVLISILFIITGVLALLGIISFR